MPALMTIPNIAIIAPPITGPGIASVAAPILGTRPRMTNMIPAM